ncbi:hypothetical protein Droror1_Dr00008581, partial [Drosera rotundifolia]
ILEALTTLRCCETFSMERLELLGDSVLKYSMSCHLFHKYPEKHEGQLSARRSSVVCNASLHRFGSHRKLQDICVFMVCVIRLVLKLVLFAEVLLRLFDGVIPQNLHLTSIIAGHYGLMTNQIMLISKESSVTYLLGKDFSLIISNPRSLHLLHVL